jgi:hypothetical protein
VLANSVFRLLESLSFGVKTQRANEFPAHLIVIAHGLPPLDSDGHGVLWLLQYDLSCEGDGRRPRNGIDTELSGPAGKYFAKVSALVKAMLSG